MKRFIIYTLTVAVFFVGLGAVVERAGARFRSDAKALEIVNRARIAIGGDAAISQVRGMVITGRSTHTLKIGDEVRTEAGESEIAIQFPDRLSQKIRIGGGQGNAEAVALTQKDVVMVRMGETGNLKPGADEGEFVTQDGKTVVVRKLEGVNMDGGGEPGEHTFTTKDGKTVVVRTASAVPGQAPAAVEGMPFEVTTDGSAKKFTVAKAYAAPRQNELVRLSLALLLTAPEGNDVSYTFGGESTLDGSPVHLVKAATGGQTYTLYFDAGSGLPVAMSHQSLEMPSIMRIKGTGVGAANAPSGDVFFRTAIKPEPENMVEKLVKFSDYRSTDGVQLPYKWTTEIKGAVSDVFEVTQFEINPTNITGRFPDTKNFVRVTKADAQK